MAKFRVGERVRYVGDIRKASWINETAVVTDINPNSGEYTVEWDRPGITNTGDARGIRESSLEPHIDWTKPLELNDGTPVALYGAVDHLAHHVTVKTLNGLAHPSRKDNPRNLISARREGGLVTSDHAYFVRNIIMPTIDTSRPLFLTYEGDQNPRAVPFITETSEGHILVGKPENGKSDWIIFTKTGEFVRSSHNSGVATRLMNKPRVVERYIPVSESGMVGTYVTKLPGQSLPSLAHLKLTYVDGILTDAAVIQQNKEPFNVG